MIKERRKEEVRKPRISKRGSKDIVRQNVGT